MNPEINNPLMLRQAQHERIIYVLSMKPIEPLILSLSKYDVVSTGLA
jgi:hypothetical protein